MSPVPVCAEPSAWSQDCHLWRRRTAVLTVRRCPASRVMMSSCCQRRADGRVRCWANLEACDPAWCSEVEVGLSCAVGRRCSVWGRWAGAVLLSVIAVGGWTRPNAWCTRLHCSHHRHHLLHRGSRRCVSLLLVRPRCCYGNWQNCGTRSPSRSFHEVTRAGKRPSGTLDSGRTGGLVAGRVGLGCFLCLGWWGSGLASSRWDLQGCCPVGLWLTSHPQTLGLHPGCLRCWDLAHFPDCGGPGGPPWTDSYCHWPCPGQARWSQSSLSCVLGKAGSLSSLSQKIGPYFLGWGRVTWWSQPIWERRHRETNQKINLVCILTSQPITEWLQINTIFLICILNMNAQHIQYFNFFKFLFN